MEPMSAIRPEKDWHIEIVRFGDIMFDYQNVQRPPDAGIKKLTQGWMRAPLLSLVCNRRSNGNISCIDGQRRILATIQRHGPDYEDRVHMFDDLFVAEESLLFDLLNGERRQVNAAYRFRAAVIAERQPHLDIIKILEGRQINYSYRGHSGDRSVVCFKAMEKIGKYGIAHFRQMIELVDDVWRADQPSIQAYYLGGVSLFIRRHENDGAWSWAEVKRKLSQQSSASIVKRHEELKPPKTSDELAVYRALHELYNRGRQDRNRLEPVRER